MGKKDTAARAAPNVSSASSLSAATSTQKSNSSSVIRSAFSPSRFQLSLFASVIQTLDSQQLRIHDTTTGRLRCEYTASRAEITALDWGYYGASYRIPDEEPSKKKRRKLEDVNGDSHGTGDVVVGFATSQSQIHLYSPAEAKILATLSEGHTHGIKDFKFSEYGLDSEAWSLGGDGKLVQWNIRDRTILRSIPSLSPNPSVMLPLLSSLLVASETAHLIELHEGGKTTKLLGGSSPALYLAASSKPTAAELSQSYLAAFQHDRYINVYDISSKVMIGSLVADANVLMAVTAEGEEADTILGIITTKGDVELFENPFAFESRTSSKSGDLKSKRKQMTKKAAATIHISRPGSTNTSVPAAGISFQDKELVIAYAEGSAHILFERMSWKDDSHDGLILRGHQNVEKTKTTLGIDGSSMNGVKDTSRLNVDESRTVVSHGANMEPDAMAVDKTEIIDISSGEEEDNDSDDDEDGDQQPGPGTALVNGVHADTEMGGADLFDRESGKEDGSDEEEDADEAEEPTFEDLVRAKATVTVDVAASFPNEQGKQMLSARQKAAKIVSGVSLTTVLSQALHSNDTAMLETCLHEKDMNVVRSTIQRLDSTYASRLLQKLAERLHSRPGRSGSLMVWVQWTLLAHGGYIGSQPHMTRQLSSLLQVVRQRGSALDSLLALKGKLDMLEGQMNLRRSTQSLHRTTTDGVDREELVTYVEGQEDSSSEEGESEDEEALEGEEEGASSDDEVDAGGAMEVDKEPDGESGDDLIDDEASETDDDNSEGEDLEDEIDYDDVDAEDESEEEAPVVTSGSKQELRNGITSKRK